MMLPLTPTRRYWQAMKLFDLRVKRDVRRLMAGEIEFTTHGGDGGRTELIREIGRAYDAGYLAGLAASERLNARSQGVREGRAHG